jgi:hypothetical protein
MAHKTAGGLEIETPQVVDAPSYVKTISKYFLEEHRDFLPCPSNMNLLLDCLRENNLVYSPENLEWCYERVKGDILPPKDVLGLDTMSAKQYQETLKKYGVEKQVMVPGQRGPVLKTIYEEPEAWRQPTKREEFTSGNWLSNDSLATDKRELSAKVAKGDKLTRKEYASLDSRQYRTFIDANGGQIPDYLLK